MEVASTVQPFEEEARASNEDFDKDSQRNEDGFSPAVLRSRLEQKKSRDWILSSLRLFYFLWRNIG